MIEKLKSYFVPVFLPENRALPFPVSYHPDMLVFRYGNRLITGKEYYDENRAVFDMIGCETTAACEKIGGKYPGDVALNAIAFGDTLIAKLDSVSEKIRELFSRSVNVSQGYAACSCCKVTENALITADTGIACAAKEAGIDVLLIRPGNIGIENYGYGFIGGASFLYGDIVFFFGDIAGHPDGKKIITFIISHGVSPVSLSNSPLHDYGGAVVIPR